MSARKATTGNSTPATVTATRGGATFTVHPYRADAEAEAESYGQAAATALCVAPQRLFKTLVADVDGALTVGVVPVSCSLDLKALAGVCGGKKARMADPADAERATGYVVGGISPLGQRKRLPTVIDESVGGFDTVFVSAGRRGLQIELAPGDLIRLTGARTAPIARAGA